jgi:hypothetical protein
MIREIISRGAQIEFDFLAEAELALERGVEFQSARAVAQVAPQIAPG